jgi:hypothetical protein
MSQRERLMTQWYWGQVGGTLIEEFVAVRRTATRGWRALDGLIVQDGERRIASKSDKIPIEGRDVIVVQTKASRLGMYLLGQAFFSAQLIQQFKPSSVISVALCSQDDSELRPLFEQYPGMRVVICALLPTGICKDIPSEGGTTN